MRVMNYIEIEGVPVPVADTLEWARWFETAERHEADGDDWNEVVLHERS